MGSFYVVMCVAALIVAGQCRAQVPVSRNQPIAPAIAPGQLPDSMFGSSGGRNPADNPRLVALGAKWLCESGF